MDLSHVFGFPLWEKAAFRRLDPDLSLDPNPDPNPNPNLNPNPNPSQAVFRLLHRDFAELHSIFGQYARPSVGARPRPG